MDKVYITKTKLQEFINELAKANSDYPKPLLTILSAIIACIFIILALLIMVIMLMSIAAYSLLSWIDIVLGKYIIKRIFKI